MTIRPFETLQRLRHRMAEAFIAQSGLTHQGLANHLRDVFARSDGEAALIPPPVFEGAFPFRPAELSLGSLSGNVLDQRTVNALAEAGGNDDYRFPRDRKPYSHQLSSWTALADANRKSVLVSAGTGSGKTECFLVPILDDLYRRGTRVQGVEAIMLYPLNALIASQQERLDAWTSDSSGRIRYCLYNGNLVERLSAAELRNSLSTAPQRVPDRQTLRSDVPPILVTNLTMLEYMLVRPQDEPILAASQGKLKWIVLDEAHTLVGSAAAEVALLLRRVMEAFGTEPSQVRFVATSATIGEGSDVENKLRRFLADMAGTGLDQVQIIEGKRVLPERSGGGGPTPNGQTLLETKPAALFEQLAAYDPVWSLIEKLGSGTASAAEVGQVSNSMGTDGETLATALTVARSSRGEFLAPLRVHCFHRAQAGLWCCTNPDCRGRTIGEGWSAGRLLYERRETCPDCSMPVAELQSCNACGEAFVAIEERGDRLLPPVDRQVTDEFLFDAVRNSEDADDGVEATTVASPEIVLTHCVSPLGKGQTLLFVDRKDGSPRDGDGPDHYKLTGYRRSGDKTCPACGEKGSHGTDKLYPFRFGAPFVISNAAPMLLEAMPAADGVKVPALPQQPPEKPASGKKLISFTDSRQGTARMAAKLQAEAERNFVRSFIYQIVQHDAAGSGDSSKIAELEGQLAALTALSDWRNNGPIAGMVGKIERQLLELKGGATRAVPWQTVRQSLANRPELTEWLPEVWGRRAKLFEHGGASYSSQIAQALLFREFLRRPKIGNSAETMGLARLVYPEIEKATDLPKLFGQHGKTLEDWKGFLTAIITFSIRNYLVVDVSRDLLNWIMRKGFPRTVVGPGLESAKGQQAWPCVNNTGRQAQVVQLLAAGLSLDPTSTADRHDINDILEKAWQVLRPLFPADSSGLQALDFDRLSVAAVRDAFFCPITRRVIDVAPFGLTPYAEKLDQLAIPIRFPKLPTDGDFATRDHFIATDPDITELRQRGIWGDLHDRIALFSPYARSAEHSAQISPERLRAYEAAFKADRINLLNCSTTMEMGVDIGSVHGVMMTNVPPSIANYRQRVGRAGRRGQAVSLAFTFARDRPLDREAFRDPHNFLCRGIAAPSVDLNSRPIVQRHVNAFLLARFLKQNSGSALRLTCGDFFGCPTKTDTKRPLAIERPSVIFADWLSRATTAEETSASINRLIHRSVLEGRTDLLSICRSEIETCTNDFEQAWTALREQLKGVSGPAMKSLEISLSRLSGEYLLSELAERGFLPGHGFPNNVVAFETGERVADQNGYLNDDRRGRRHGGPQRPLDVAIRDYAPGTETVVDGKVYRVGGVTLNWKRPSSEEGVREVQALRWAARCAVCGDSWTGLGHHPASCRHCDSPSLELVEYLKPAGFLRDFRIEPHAEVDQLAFVPPEPARVSAGGVAWEPLTVPQVGRFRLNRRGTVFYHSKGGKQLGYGLCLVCGRMEAMGEGETVCESLVDHKPLRSWEGQSEPCPGNAQPFAIRHGIMLGHEIYTDVLEFQPAAQPSIAAANAIAIALREVTAKHLGIEPDEMGFGLGPSHNTMMMGTLSIFLYDRASGGAGYVTAAANNLRPLLKMARQHLDCPRGCANACSACVQVPDAPEGLDELDRKAAIAFMDAHIQLPDLLPGADVFAQGADLSDRPLHEIDDLMTAHGKASLTVWVSPEDIVSLSSWSAVPLMHRWAANGRKITLVVPSGYLAGLDASQLLYLRDFVNRHGLSLAEGASHSFNNGATLFASLDAAEKSVGWACRDRAFLAPGPDWALDLTHAIARAPFIHEPMLKAIGTGDLTPPLASHVEVLGEQIDGSLSGFGQRLAKTMRQAVEATGIAASDQLVKAEYADRFMRAPLNLRLLIDTISGLASGKNVALTILTAPDKRPAFSRNRVFSDVADDNLLAGYARAYGAIANLTVDLKIGQPAHKRSLVTYFHSGERRIIDLDQGFGWLELREADTRFDTTKDPDGVAQLLLSLTGELARRHGHDSQMVCWRETGLLSSK